MEVHILYAQGSRAPPPRFSLTCRAMALGTKRTARSFCSDTVAEFLPTGILEVPCFLKNKAFVRSKTDRVTLPLFCYWQLIAFGVQKLRLVKKHIPYFAYFITYSQLVFARSQTARSDCVCQSTICSLYSFKLICVNTLV